MNPACLMGGGFCMLMRLVDFLELAARRGYLSAATLASGRHLFRADTKPTSSRSTHSPMMEYIAYHPKVLEYAIPDTEAEIWRRVEDRIWRNYHAKPLEQEILIPCCPCCGEGRTLFCHIKKEPDLVIPADFTDWCSDCRKKMASMVRI